MELVIGAEGEVLDAGGVVVPVEVFLDLRLLLARGGLVDGHLDEALAAGHDLGHQGGVVGGDVLVVEGHEHLEAEDVLVEFDPVVHLAEFDVADEVVGVLEAAGVLGVRVVEILEEFGLGEAGEDAPFAGAGGELDGRESVLARGGALDKGVDDLAVGLDRRGDDGAVFVLELGGLLGGGAAVLEGLAVRGFGVVDGEGDVLDAVAVEADVARGGVVLGEAGGEDEADVALREVVVGGIARAGGLVADLLAGESEAVGVEVCGLLGVAAVEADIVDVDELQRVGGLG